LSIVFAENISGDLMADIQAEATLTTSVKEEMPVPKYSATERGPCRPNNLFDPPDDLVHWLRACKSAR